MDALAVFAEAAQDLRRRVGEPTKVWLSSSSGISRQALDDLLNGSRKPRWPTVARYVVTCKARAGSGVDPGLFTLERWRDLHAAIDAPAGGRELVFGHPPPIARAFQERVMGLEAAGCYILAGTGGTGKTQIARHVWDDLGSDVRIWTDGTSRDAIVASYAAAHAEITGAAVDSETEAAKQFLAWLGRTGRRWLVVIDDLHVPGDLDGLSPPVGHPSGHTIVTTRRADDALDGHGRILVPVGVFTPAESLAFLQQRLGPAGLTDGAAALAAALGYLPLALAQAVTFQIDRRLTCAGYLERMAGAPLSTLVPEQGSRPDGQPGSVVMTWSISVELADSLQPAGVARPVIELLSLLDPSGIPGAMLKTDAVTRHLGVDAQGAEDGLHCLRRLNLVDYRDEPFREIGLHRVVHRVTREHLSAPELARIARVAAEGLTDLWPDERSAQVAPPYLRTNARAVIDHCGGSLVAGGGHPLVHRFIMSAGESGDIEAAIGHCESLYALAESLLGPGHRTALELRHDLLYWLGSSGERAAARSRSTDLIADCGRHLGGGDELTLSARMYRARWAGMGGDAATAVGELTDLVGDYHQAGLADHPTLLTLRADLAHFIGGAGDPGGAVTEFRDLVSMRQRQDGSDHPYTLQARNGQAFWTWKAGAIGVATVEFAALLDDCLRILGPFHRYTLGARGNLAQCRGDAGDIAAAVAGLERALRDATQSLGPEHPLARRTRTYLDSWRARQPDDV
ncbi:Kinesin light chain 2 [Actinoplanes sp. TRM 88003]|uniref:Kinesin light chain 2 n=1 Tax=Paractinoplanes aksuensis TaxID=2939490 RepID=A0ABT1DW22_9ACTN|nr:Kinesin light chain 2 [Actinoplanes aksuensis]MCO8275060.1 Kinesin light chain 2 [Actinoplanes aksuensis]